MHKVLFVCLGNICRSPAAEGFMLHLIKEKNLESKFHIDSAGTSAYHSGSPADGRMQAHANDRGYHLPSVSRPFLRKDFQRFDLIITMDDENYVNVISLAQSIDEKNKVFKMTSFCQIHERTEVPDPYYGGAQGFDIVLDIVEDGCHGILKHLKL